MARIRTAIPIFFVALALMFGALPSANSAAAWAPEAAVTVSAADTVSGKLTAVTADRITIEMQEQGQPRAVSFERNKETKVDGELQAGATVEITYRAEGERYIAVAVKVVA